MDCKKCKQSGKVFDDDLDKARLTKINRRLVAAIVIIVLFAITAIVVNNIVWLNKWTQFDTVSYSYDQDGEGVNVIGNENGVKYNVTEVESESADQTDPQHQRRPRKTGEEQKKKMKDIEYANSAMEHAIDEYIHNKQYRLILKLYYIDGESPYTIANHPEVTIQERQINNVIRKCLRKLADYI